MKTKYTAMSFSILLIMGLVAPFINSAKAVTQPTVYVSPASVGPLAPLSTFTVSVMINSPDISIWSGQIGIGWNPAVLDCTSFTKGSAIDASWLWLSGTINHTGGYVSFSGWSCTAGEEPGWNSTSPVPGDGEFVKYTFKVLTYYNGNVDLNLTSAVGNPSPDKFYKTKLNEKVDSTIQEITPITLVDGTFVGMPPPPPYGPTAHLTVTPSTGTEPLLVTLDGSTSTPGFDGTNPVPIDTYYFDFGDLSPIVVQTTPTTTHTYAAGTWTANLTVHAATPVNPYSTDLKQVKVFAKPTGPNIDLYTQNYRSYITDGTGHDHWTPYNGTGPSQPADAYTSQDLVKLYAKVTYNNDIVAQKLVTFEVHFPNGTTALTRTAMTDLNGVAEVDFRIPAPCDGADKVFGTWFVYADVDIAEVKVYDNMTFLVGWIIDTYNDWTTMGLYGPAYTPGPTWLTITDPINKGQVATVNDTVINIAYVNVFAQFATTLYDEQNYPIGFMTFNMIVPGRASYPDGAIVVTPIGPYNFQIPMWAYVGVGTVFMNAYTAIPSQCGLPYSPEEAVSFEIKPAI